MGNDANTDQVVGVVGRDRSSCNIRRRRDVQFGVVPAWKHDVGSRPGEAQKMADMGIVVAAGGQWIRRRLASRTEIRETDLHRSTMWMREG